MFLFRIIDIPALWYIPQPISFHGGAEQVGVWWYQNLEATRRTCWVFHRDHPKILPLRVTLHGSFLIFFLSGLSLFPKAPGWEAEFFPGLEPQVLGEAKMGGLENHCPQMAMWGRSFSDKPNCFISGRTNKLWLLFTVIYPEYHPTHATYQGPAKSTAWQPSGGGGGFSGGDLICLIRGSTPKMRYLDHHETSAGDLEVNKTEDSVPRTDPVLTKNNFQRLWTCLGWLVKQLVKSYDCLWWSQSKKASSQNCFFLVCFRWHVPKKNCIFLR